MSLENLKRHGLFLNLSSPEAPRIETRAHRISSRKLWRSNILSLVQTEVVLGRIQQPIIDFTRPWDDFMVRGVKQHHSR